MTETTGRPIGAMRAALFNRCPHCGEGRLLTGLLTPADACAACETDFTRHGAGDGAVFIVLTILCFAVVGFALFLELAYQPSLWMHMLASLVVTVGLGLALLPVTKRFMIAQSIRLDAGAETADTGAERDG